VLPQAAGENVENAFEEEAAVRPIESDKDGVTDGEWRL
jgi:hypothetical protein